MALQLFDKWRGQSLDGIIAECREVVEGADFPTVKRWREAGGKVVGHFEIYFPEEIAHAAGMLPLKMRGAPVDCMHSVSRFGSYLCVQSSTLRLNTFAEQESRIEYVCHASHL